ncbi:MAG: N-6 DNA methylase [Spirochaetales bacterium]|nr:N-6 DNA methylase [Spirochaetales bacterium]
MSKKINDYIELPTIPIYEQKPEDIGLLRRRDLKPTVNLRIVFNDIRNYIAGNSTGITTDEPIAGEIINLLFCKIYDEINTAPDDILKFRHGINESTNDIKIRIFELFNNVKKQYSDVFSQYDTIRLDEHTLAYIVGELQNYCITGASRDIIGEAFEVFIGPALKGSQGQFFTPKNLVKTAIHICNPDKNTKIIDPACGSGGFLFVALEYVWKKINDEADIRGFGRHWIKKEKDNFTQKMIRGIEKDSFLSKISRAYMAIVGDGRGSIFCENSLEKPDRWNSLAQDRIISGEFDLVVTNPPFGAKIIISDEEILENYDLGHKWQKGKDGKWVKTDKLLKMQSPQILFIERCYQLLKNGGKLGIILPDGILGGSKIGYVPYWILSKFSLIAAIDCPIETFSPNTTTKVHLLILQKKKSKADDKIFLAVPELVGHDKKGHIVYRDRRNEIIRDDLDVVKNQWDSFINTKLIPDKFGYSLDYKELEYSLNAKRYLPHFMDNLRFVHNYNGKKLTINHIKSKLSTGANVDNLDYVDKDYPCSRPYILVKNVQDDGLSYSNLKYIRPGCYDSHKNAIVKAGDIIINRCGDAGIAAIVPEDFEGSLVCGFCFILRVKKEYNPEYIVSYLNSAYGRLQLKRLSIGSILEHITKEELSNVLILFPENESTEKNIINLHKNVVKSRIQARKGLNSIYDHFKNLF